MLWPPPDSIAVEPGEFAEFMAIAVDQLGAGHRGEVDVDNLGRRFIRMELSRPQPVDKQQRYPQDRFTRDLAALVQLGLARRSRKAHVHELLPLPSRRPNIKLLRSYLSPSTAGVSGTKTHTDPDPVPRSQANFVRLLRDSLDAAQGHKQRHNAARVLFHNLWHSASYTHNHQEVAAFMVEWMTALDFGDSDLLRATVRFADTWHADLALDSLAKAVAERSDGLGPEQSVVTAQLARHCIRRGQYSVAMRLLTQTEIPLAKAIRELDLAGLAEWLVDMPASQYDESDLSQALLAFFLEHLPEFPHVVSSPDSDWLTAVGQAALVRVLTRNRDVTRQLGLLMSRPGHHGQSKAEAEAYGLLELFTRDAAQRHPEPATLQYVALAIRFLPRSPAESDVAPEAFRRFDESVSQIPMPSRLRIPPTLLKLAADRGSCSAMACLLSGDQTLDSVYLEPLLGSLNMDPSSGFRETKSGIHLHDDPALASRLEELCVQQAAAERRREEEAERVKEDRENRLRQKAERLKQDKQRREESRERGRIATEKKKARMGELVEELGGWCDLPEPPWDLVIKKLDILAFLEVRHAREHALALADSYRAAGYEVVLRAAEFKSSTMRRWQTKQRFRAAPHNTLSLDQLGDLHTAALDVLARAPRPSLDPTLDETEASPPANPAPLTLDPKLCRKRLRQCLRFLITRLQQGQRIQPLDLSEIVTQSSCALHSLPPQVGEMADALLGLIHDGHFVWGRDGIEATPDTYATAGRFRVEFADSKLDGHPAGSWPLYRWQSEALHSWHVHGRQGVIEAVTGAGKTRLGVIAALEAHIAGLMTVVLVPKRVLQEQWFEAFAVALDQIFGPGNSAGRPHVYGMGNQHHLPAGVNSGIVIAVVNSFAMAVDTPRFPASNVLLIADECHNYWGTDGRPGEYSKALAPQFAARLGLTATLEGSGVLNYFRDTVYRLGLQQALEERIVSPYRLLMVGVPLAPKELVAYDRAQAELAIAQRRLFAESETLRGYRGRFIELTEGLIALSQRREHPLCELAKAWVSALQERTEIVANSKGKSQALALAFPAVKSSSGTLVFTLFKEPAKDACRRLLAAGIAADIIDGDSDKDFRQEVISALGRQDLQAVVAPRILDEGINVPSIDTAVIVSTSKRRRQIIQRLGRIIRLKPTGAPLPMLVILFSERTDEDPATGKEGEERQSFLDELRDNADPGPHGFRVCRVSDGQETVEQEVLEFVLFDRSARLNGPSR